MLSRRKSASFLPVGKNFKKVVHPFLAEGKPGLPASDFQLPHRTLTPAGAARKIYKLQGRVPQAAP